MKLPKGYSPPSLEPKISADLSDVFPHADVKVTLTGSNDWALLRTAVVNNEPMCHLDGRIGDVEMPNPIIFEWLLNSLIKPVNGIANDSDGFSVRCDDFPDDSGLAKLMDEHEAFSLILSFLIQTIPDIIAGFDIARAQSQRAQEPEPSYIRV